MVSGCHIIVILYSDSKLLNDSKRIISSASRAEITPRSVRPRSRRSYHCCSEKYPPVAATISRHSGMKLPLRIVSPLFLPCLFTGKTKCTSGCASAAVCTQLGQRPHESPS